VLSPPHQIVILVLAGEPFLLSMLAGKLLAKDFPEVLHQVDSTVRFGAAGEVRPDLLFTILDDAQWVALEVQLWLDPQKTCRWPLLMGVLIGEYGTVGDLVILTPNRAVAQWAARTCDGEGLLGTVHRIVPTVLWVSEDKLDCLLDEACPRLAFFAAWAMHDRHGPRAESVVRKALRITELLPEPLRTTQTQAILGVLNERLLLKVKEKPMGLNVDPFPETPWLRQWRLELEAAGVVRGLAEGKVEGKREALFTILKARGMNASPREQAQILQCSDLVTLNQWIAGAACASSVKAALASVPKPPIPRKRRTRMAPDRVAPPEGSAT
jgi:hypothetical protein